jgi:hypothetical protein
MEKEAKFLTGITLVIAAIEIYYLILMGCVGPLYDKPFEAKLTYFDTGIYDGQNACFQLQIVSLKNESRLVSASIDGRQFASSNLSSGKYEYCTESGYGNHTVEIAVDTDESNYIILNESYLRFSFVKSSETPGEKQESSLDVAQNGNVSISVFNGEYRERVYYVEFGTDSSYVQLGPLEGTTLEKETPESDTKVSVNGFSETVHGTGSSFDLLSFALGIALMFMTGFAVFYNRTLEGTLKAVLFSYAMLVFISLALNNFLGSITFQGMAAGTAIIAIAGILFKKQLVRLVK